MKRLVLLTAAVVLAGCSYYADQRTADAAKVQMVGQSRAQVLACMGAPAGSAIADTSEVWSYGGNDQTVTMLMPAGTAALGVSHTYTCRAHVTFQEGRVVNVRYQSRGAFDAPDYVCGPLVQACVRR